MKHKKNLILLVTLFALFLCFIAEPSFAALSYEIERGDTLWRIAKSYDLTVADLLGSNPNLNAERLQIGQRILIPSFPHFHVVEEKETLWSISRLYGLSLGSLMEANRLTEASVIGIGQRLLVPSRGQETVLQYIVRPGDTYWSLAVKHRTSVDYLMRLNHMVPPERLQVGSMIRLPLDLSAKAKEHVVVWGDTLYKVSLKYGVSVENLMNLNGLRRPEDLQVGQVLIVEM